MASRIDFTSETLEIWSAMEGSVRTYIARKQSEVGPFCRKYYSWNGLIHVHLASIKEDLLTNPLNTFWAIPFAVLKNGCEWIRKLGWNGPSHLLGMIPSQLKTGSQKKIEWFLLTELLELPFDMGMLKSAHDGLANEFSKNPKLAPLRNDSAWKTIFHTDPRLWKAELAADCAERSSAADVASNGATLLTAWYLFGTTALGAFDMGERYARRTARHEAVSHFFLGHKLGSVYYNLFPQNPTQSQVYMATAGVMAGIALFSLVIHAVIDPIHQMMGLHEKRLQKFLTALENRLLDNIRTQMSEKLFGKHAWVAEPVQVTGSASLALEVRITS
jgi:hypothetical protein